MIELEYIVLLIEKHGALTAQELYKLCYNVMRERDFKDALRGAIEIGRLRVTTKDNHNVVALPDGQ